MRRSLLRVGWILGALAAAAAVADESSPPYSVRDTNAARYALESARKALSAGETRRGLSELQRILDGLRDDLIVLPAEADAAQTRYLPAPEAARREIEALPPAGRAIYEEVAGPAARALLDHALAERDEGLLREVLARYADTAAGAAAARWLSDASFERGHPWDAVAAARAGLRAAPKDPLLWLRLVDALEAARDAKALAALAVPEGMPAEVATAAGSVRLADRLAAAREKAGPVPAPKDVPGWDGGPEHDDRPPWDHVLRPLRWAVGSSPTWRRNDDSPVFGMPSEGQGQFESRWSQAAPYFPALDGRRVVVSDGLTVKAYDLLSGRLAWSFPAPGRPPRGLEVVSASSGALAGRTNLDVAYAPCVADGLVYATVEVPDPTYVPRRLNSIEITTYRPRRLLVALDAATGELRWRMGVDAADRAALAGLSLGGPPVAAEGLVVGVGVEFDKRWRAALVAFDGRTGRLRWRRDVVTSQQELNLFGEPVKELWAGAPAVSDGVVYAPTGLGVLVAADLRTGEIRWLTAYEAAQIERVEFWYATPLRFASWGPSPVVAHGDAVLVAPADSVYLHCFDKADGRLRWRERAQATRDSPFADYFLGVANDGKRDVALVTGRDLRALDVVHGQIVWTARLSQSALVRGRGAASRTRVYVPTTEGLEVFSLPGEGRLLPPGPTPWPERAQPGNLLLTPQVLIVAGGAWTPDEDGQVTPIQAFFDPDDIERAIQARGAAATDPEPVLEVADLCRLVGRDARAEELYAKAARLAAAAHDAGAAERARQGTYLLWRDRGDAAAATPDRSGDARSAYEGALARAGGAAERVAVRLRLDRLLRDRGLENARVRNLEALAAEAGGERAVFTPKEGEVPARPAARFLLAEIHRKAGRAADAVDALQAVLREDGDALMGDEPARARAKRVLEAILAASGPAPYRRYEAEAAARLAEAAKGADPAPFERILAEFPNARAVPDALLGLAERQTAAGTPAAAAATLRRFLSAYPEHPQAPRGLALLARALAASASPGPARAAVEALARRHPQAQFELDGKSWTGLSFAEAERARAGALPPAPPPHPLARRPEERWMQAVEGQASGARVLEVDGADAAAVPPPVLVDTGDEVVAIDPETARPRWHGAWPSASRAALVGDALVLAVADALVAVDPATGEERWRRETPGDATDVREGLGQAIALVRSPGVLVRTRLLALDPVTSDVLWRRDLPGDPVERILVGQDGIAALRRKGTSTGFVWAVSIHSLLTGEVVRDLPLPVDAATESGALVADGRQLVYLARDWDGLRLEACDMATGRSRWSRPLAADTARVGYVQRHLLARAGTVLLAESTGRLRAFSCDTGDPIGETAVTGGLRVVSERAMVLGEDRLYALLREGNRGQSSLSAFDLKTGRALWSLPLKGVNQGLILPSGDVLAVVLSPMIQATARGTVAQPSEYQVLVVDARDGTEAVRITPRGLGHYLPSAAVRAGTLVVAGQRAFAAYR